MAKPIAPVDMYRTPDGKVVSGDKLKGAGILIARAGREVDSKDLAALGGTSKAVKPAATKAVKPAENK